MNFIKSPFCPNGNYASLIFWIYCESEEFGVISSISSSLWEAIQCSCASISLRGMEVGAWEGTRPPPGNPQEGCRHAAGRHCSLHREETISPLFATVSRTPRGQPLGRAKSKPASSQQKWSGPAPDPEEVAGGGLSRLCVVLPQKGEIGLWWHLFAGRASQKRLDVQRHTSRKYLTLRAACSLPFFMFQDIQMNSPPPLFFFFHERLRLFSFFRIELLYLEIELGKGNLLWKRVWEFNRSLRLFC